MTACAASWIPTGVLTHDCQYSFLDPFEDCPHPIVDYQFSPLDPYKGAGPWLLMLAVHYHCTNAALYSAGPWLLVQLLGPYRCVCKSLTVDVARGTSSP